MGKIGNLDAKFSWVLGGYWLASLKKSAGVPTQKIVAENSAQQSRAAITRIEAKNRDAG